MLPILCLHSRSFIHPFAFHRNDEHSHTHWSKSTAKYPKGGVYRVNDVISLYSNLHYPSHCFVGTFIDFWPLEHFDNNWVLYATLNIRRYLDVWFNVFRTLWTSDGRWKITFCSICNSYSNFLFYTVHTCILTSNETSLCQ